MRHLPFALLAAACATAPSAAVLDAAPPPGAFVLTRSGPLVGGAPAEFQVTGLLPGVTVHLAASGRSAGPRACPAALAPVCLDMHGPASIVGSAVADAAGVASVRFTPPDLSADQPVVFQAVVRQPGVVYKGAAWPDTLLDPDGDRDRDGLITRLELALATDPAAADSDVDGVPDGREDPDLDRIGTLDELWLGLDPLLADTDADGTPDGDEDFDIDELGLADELLAGTDPANDDTDRDGLNDLWEVLFGIAPLDPDADDDGCSDHDEWMLDVSNPMLPDTDGDGILDCAPGGAEDRDGDGLWDRLERDCGTALGDPDSDDDGVLDGADDADHNGFSNLLEVRTGGQEVTMRCNQARPDEADMDGDYDAMPVSAEVANGTSHIVRDSDGDGVWDGYELAGGLDPLSRDSDGVGDALSLLLHTPGVEPVDEAGFAAATTTGAPVLVLFTSAQSPLTGAAAFSIAALSGFPSADLRVVVHDATPAPGVITGPARQWAMHGPFLVAPTMVLFAGDGAAVGTARGPVGVWELDYYRDIAADLADGVLGN